MITQPDLFELPPAVIPPTAALARSRKQHTILHFLRAHPDVSLSITDAQPLIGWGIYTNQKKHIQRVLSNMVRRGLLIRPKHGLYALPK
jgi:hypothetical protein